MECSYRRNSLCGQINDVLCYFGGLGPVTKLRLLKAYCSSYYGYELWDLFCKAVDDFCIMWRKGLKRVWGLPRDTQFLGEMQRIAFRLLLSSCVCVSVCVCVCAAFVDLRKTV